MGKNGQDQAQLLTQTEKMIESTERVQKEVEEEKNGRIGFELKKAFNRRGLFAAVRALMGIVCTGPMLLGIVLLLGILFLCSLTGARTQRKKAFLVCMITYAFCLR